MTNKIEFILPESFKAFRETIQKISKTGGYSPVFDEFCMERGNSPYFSHRLLKYLYNNNNKESGGFLCFKKTSRFTPPQLINKLGKMLNE
ncbi:MAG: hypothetical protein NC820_08180 [Candidatus Omnitrophica bacterium]|nr:hypothetical protein [Candidatus Omnitrophota bacterium]